MMLLIKDNLILHMTTHYLYESRINSRFIYLNSFESYILVVRIHLEMAIDFDLMWKWLTLYWYLYPNRLASITHTLVTTLTFMNVKCRHAVSFCDHQLYALIKFTRNSNWDVSILLFNHHCIIFKCKLI